MNSKNISKDEKSKQIKTKVNIETIKSDFFLIKLFKILKIKKSLKIIKNNKQLQKRANISINNFNNRNRIKSYK